MIKKTIFPLLALLMLLTQVVACDYLEQNIVKSSKRAEISILGIAPRSFDGYLIPGESLKFWVEVKPLNVLPDTGYELVLFTRSGVIQATKYLYWEVDDLSGADPSERDIRKIRESENRATRSVDLYANANDKEIEPLWREFNSFYKECRQKAAERGELEFRGLDGWNAGSYEPDETDFGRICSKYIEIKILTREEYDELEDE